MKIKGEADTTITSIEGRLDGAIGEYIPRGALTQPLRLRFDPKCSIPPSEIVGCMKDDWQIWYTSRGNQRITGWVCDHVIDVFRSVRITDDTPSHIVRRVIEKGKQMIINTDGNQAAEEIRLGRMV